MKTRQATATMYRDQNGEYRWRLRATNGRIVADCGEGYKTKGGCERGYLSAMQCISAARVVEDYERK